MNATFKRAHVGARQHTMFTIQIVATECRLTSRKLADAEIHFHGGELDGTTLPGFAVWVNATGAGERVTFSSRMFSTRGQQRSFSMLRWIAKREANERMADAVWRAYRRYRRASISDALT
jgi:hypothetical protein